MQPLVSIIIANDNDGQYGPTAPARLMQFPDHFRP